MNMIGETLSIWINRITLDYWRCLAGGEQNPVYSELPLGLNQFMVDKIFKGVLTSARELSSNIG